MNDPLKTDPQIFSLRRLVSLESVLTDPETILAYEAKQQARKFLQGLEESKVAPSDPALAGYVLEIEFTLRPLVLSAQEQALQNVGPTARLVYGYCLGSDEDEIHFTLNDGTRPEKIPESISCPEDALLRAVGFDRMDYESKDWAEDYESKDWAEDYRQAKDRVSVERIVNGSDYSLGELLVYAPLTTSVDWMEVAEVSTDRDTTEADKELEWALGVLGIRMDVLKPRWLLMSLYF